MKKKEYNIQTKKKADLTLALLADIHGFPMDKKLYSEIRKEKPDDIIIAGDLIDEERPFSKSTEELLRQCTDIAPTWFAFGNNDEVLKPQDLDIMRHMRIGILDNQWVKIHENIYLGGLTSAMVLRCRKYGLHAKEKVNTETSWLKEFEKLNGYKILIDHHPENYRLYTRNLNIDLILSGHTHGGQISLFGYGLLVPGQMRMWPRYSGGYYEQKLIVSRGLSNTLPIPRVGNPTEIVFVHIHKK